MTFDLDPTCTLCLLLGGLYLKYVLQTVLDVWSKEEMGALFEWCSSSGIIQTICSIADSSLESLRTIPHHATGEKQVQVSANGTWQPCWSRLHYRLLKKLREKDARQIELEKREQGFALYLNGANLLRTANHPQAPPTRKSRHVDTDVCNQPERKRPSKTAGKVYKSSSSDLKINFRVAFCFVHLVSVYLQILTTTLARRRRRTEQRLLLQRERVGQLTLSSWGQKVVTLYMSKLPVLLYMKL